jgi:hypothetical protein
MDETLRRPGPDPPPRLRRSPADRALLARPAVPLSRDGNSTPPARANPQKKMFGTNPAVPR